MPEPFPIAIDPARPADDGPISALLNRAIERTHVHFATKPTTPQQVAIEREAATGRHPWLVARARGDFAGFARAHPWRSRDAYRHTCEVALYVEPRHQGHGVGRSLYDHLLDALREHGFHTAIACIALPNDASTRLHEAMGFGRIGVCREVGRKFDAWHDVLFMQAML